MKPYPHAYRVSAESSVTGPAPLPSPGLPRMRRHRRRNSMGPEAYGRPRLCSSGRTARRKTRTIPPSDPACAQCPRSRVLLRVRWENESAARTGSVNAFLDERRVAKLRPVSGKIAISPERRNLRNR
jgi:hypothetical protein